MRAHSLGFPRIGARRELKFALESYWRGEIDQATLEETGKTLRRRHWALQKAAGMDLVTVGDFSFYDTVLDHSVMFGAIPQRFAWDGGSVDLDLYFRMARGRAPSGTPTSACTMTKWFDTNYHYLAPELDRNQTFRLGSERLFAEVDEARDLGLPIKPVLLGPLTWLWLARPQGAFDRLDLLDGLLTLYAEILHRLAGQGAEWVQIDEPILVLDLPPAWRQAFEAAYNRLQTAPAKLMLTTYFGGLEDNLSLALSLPTAGIHLDLKRAPEQLTAALDHLPPYKTLSLGLVDGRNVWRTDPDAAIPPLRHAVERLGVDRVWVAPSCSLLHVPVDLESESGLDEELRAWLSFAVQKLDEVKLLQRVFEEGEESVAGPLRTARQAIASRRASPRIHRPEVAERLSRVDDTLLRRRNPYPVRRVRQREVLPLPLFPTTTIGSFPQTPAIRQARRDWRQGLLSEAEYRTRMHDEIAHAIRQQESCGLDVLVHGEAERNDMVEYFGELLEGFAVTRQGWVQSYGSRCVKPPILYGDVSRARPMTVEWIRHAQSLTERPVKGMLTGPVTLLNWSFVRDDQARNRTCEQIALAIRDEVRDLESAGIRVIQIDEAALREGLPLRRHDRPNYLAWAVRAFRLASAGVGDQTQIHTHMCYSQFNDIIRSIAAMDADVITIETTRSQMALLEAFVDFAYPNEIGPGVYDIHSPNIPKVDTMTQLMRKAARYIPPERLWVNPDCGLKTRSWEEVVPALHNLVAAARQLRDEFSQTENSEDQAFPERRPTAKS